MKPGPTPTHYQTIDKEGVAEFKDRGSRFIAIAFPAGDADAFKVRYQQIKDEHPKANHWCFAYRFGVEGNAFRANDAGEPSGSAGRPILGQIDSRELIDVAVVVVRYFGGTLLGVPGLIHAYKTAASLALQVVPVIRRPLEKRIRIELDYTRLNEVMLILKQAQARILAQDIQLFCHVEATVPVVRFDEVIYRLRDIAGVQATTS